VIDDVRIDQDGIWPSTDAARALLAHKSGDWKLLEGGPDLLIAVRDSGQGLYPEVQRLSPGPAALAGDLGEMLPSDLLNFLQQGHRTGVLLTKSAGVERAIVLLEGTVAWAASTSPGERFGELICRMGLVPRAALDDTLRAQAHDHNHRPLGQLLGERGLLEPDDCWRALRHQVVEIFLGLLVLRSGSFLFHRGFDVERLPAQLALDIEALLLDGLRRLDEMEFYRQRVPSPSLVPQPTGLALPDAESEEISDEMRRLFKLVDGKSSLAQLAETSALGEFEATKAAYKLMQSGQLVPEGSEPAPRSEPQSDPQGPFDPQSPFHGTPEQGGW
jgi:Domain of unknown function (DUF4388)